MAKNTTTEPKEIVDETAVVAPLDDHADAQNRHLLPVHTIRGVLKPDYETADGNRYSFLNQGHMVTFVSCFNVGDQPAAVRFRSLNPQNDLVVEVPVMGMPMDVGPFADVHFNRPDQSVWIDAPAQVAFCVKRLGI